MADNYLGRKMEEYFARPAAKTSHKMLGTLSRLVSKNRSHRSYDPRFEVRDDQLQRILSVVNRLPSARNAQVLRYRPVPHREAHLMQPLIALGAALPDLHLPSPDTPPSAYIIICSTVDETRYVDIDLGIAAQTLLLQAVEMGLNGICIAAFDAARVKETFSLESRPLLVLGLGRGTDTISLKEIRSGEDTAYYREDGVHYVPKLSLDDLIITGGQDVDPHMESSDK